MVGMSIMVALIRIVVTIDRMRDMVMFMLQVVNVVTLWPGLLTGQSLSE